MTIDENEPVKVTPDGSKYDDQRTRFTDKSTRKHERAITPHYIWDAQPP